MSTSFVVRRRVRFGDCDPGGVLYTPRIGYFVVEAVLDFLTDRLSGPAERRLLDLGIFPPARAFSVEFLKPMAWDDELEIHVCVKELRTHAICFSVDGILSGEKTFVAELTQVCVSSQTRRPVAIPSALRNALAEENTGEQQ
ncbi:acyl-CoA thioesterase [Microbulbifer taiwanensis]|uniref:Acyl-CoA thioesterase n=1 Tax=Microbulbifer taiwanensis TaxID=986746 RepID=A0ABW1YH37_9GAMM|nr:thioesterase family protein [Microbulbifer taiwanensis]